MFVVGDDSQCQPPGTMIETPFGKKKIEDLNDSDKVLCWDRKSQYVSKKGYNFSKGIRNYNGPLFKVITEDGTTSCTANHKFLVRWTDRDTSRFVVYLMYRQDRGFRIGWCQLFTKGGAFHLGQRARLEKAEKLWVLCSIKNKKDATKYESILSIKYGISTCMFEPSGELYTEEVLSAIFSEAEEAKGHLCLLEHNMRFDLPLYPYPNRRDKAGSPTYFECYASNLLDSMKIPLPSSKSIPNLWTKIINIETSHYEGPVYSLDVEKHHNYVSDGLVTLNSIYGWRFADISNILNFQEDYEGKLYKLEQNYRSTTTILDAANAVIKNNKGQIDKTLWTENVRGEKIIFYTAENEYEEARTIASLIEGTIELKGKKPGDFAILYRTNMLSRVIEETLISRSIPCQVVGGTSFYERKEIKDMLAYLRAINNPRDSISLARIINTPKRNIGEATVTKLKAYMAENDCSLAQTLDHIEEVPGKIAKKTVNKIKEFSEIMNDLIAFSSEPGRTSEQIIKAVLEATGYVKALEESGKEEELQRADNIDELTRIAKEYDKNSPEGDKLSSFLINMSLVSDVDSMEDADTVKLLTVHAAKGLEFPFVFIMGAEEGIFPHGSAIASGPDEVEEERRLFYVAITRAKERLYMTMALKRNPFGMDPDFLPRNKPSRFLREVPKNLITKI